MIALVAAFSVAACSGGGMRGTLPQPVPTSSSSAAAYNGPLASVTFTFRIPGTSTSANTRRPSYVSSATKSIKLVLNTSSTLTVSQVTAYNLRPWGTINVGTLPNATCPASGSDFVCTVAILIPPGSDNLTFSLYDNTNATGNILSQQIQTLTVNVGTSNSFNVIFDANANIMTVNAASGFCAGTFTVANSGTVGTVGTTPVSFSASFTDLATKTIVGPGLPLLTVNGHTDDNGGAGYTDGTTHLNVKVNQAAQTFTLTQTAGTGNAAVAVAATPANGTDGLSFNKTLNFTFQSGPAPPPSFLAVIEQTGSASGKIDLFTVTLGASDTFTPYSTPTLANQSNDVDFPQDLLFDPNGDLLIANGGAGNPDFGNFACVPAGAIATGANAATVLTTNMDDPAFLALGTDSTVALANVPGAAAVKVEEFELSGAYTPDSGTRNITNATYPGLGTNGVIALPITGTNPSGSFASSITNGTTVSHIVIKRPDGTSTQIDNTHIVAPSLAYDSFNNQIAAASVNGANSWLNFVNPTSFAVVKQFVLEDSNCYSAGAYTNCPPGGVATPGGPSNMKGSVIAASSSGYVAVGGITASGEPEVQVYNPSHDPTGGPIPYDATTTPGGATFVYGSATIIVHALRFVTGTKLMVSLESDTAGSQGIYIYDVTQLVSPCICYDVNANQFANSPKQTGFQQLNNIPLSVAYKP